MNILYRITYLPHLEAKTPPYYYVGSKYNYKGNYWGSPASVQLDWYSTNLTIRDWWKQEIKNKNNFSFEVLEILSECNPHQLVEEEKLLHLKLNVKHSNEYFNKAIATAGWVSIPRTEETKKKVSKITKAYWDKNNEQAQKRRKQLSEAEWQTPERKKERWKNPTFAMIEMVKKLGQTSRKGIKDKRPRKPKNNIKIISGDGVIYENAKKAGKEIGISPVNIRRRCRLSIYSNWYYVN